ncbi:MAG TPA: potassium-transporting ATPase subunit KdpB [Verrucomicrobiae bacterium]|jgi:K+-transporting ATPase ATPase B chain|nr:potassium-transporting ATPase subunit KdpB [Verrucomicrobiae bacterium]
MSTRVEFKYSQLFRQAVIDAFKKLNPRDEIKNLVMFVVWIGSIWTTIILFLPGQCNLFNLQICFWLWFTCLFANFAEAMAEGRGKAHADALRALRTKTMARKIVDGKEMLVPANELKVGDCYICQAGEFVPADGDIVEGIATVDESAITGESAPVVRESGGDRSAVTGGTKVISDKIIVRVTAESGDSFLDRMISMIEGARRQKTPNEIALNIVLVSLTALFIVVVFVLPPYAHYNEAQAGQKDVVLTTIPVLLSLIVCLIPTTIGGLLSAIGIAGIDRLMRRNVLATSGRAVEAAGDVDVLLLDKTGTITLGNRQATEFIPGPGVKLEELADAAQLASLADETPEGRSIVALAKEKYELRGREIAETFATFIPFTAQTRMSGVDLYDERRGGDSRPATTPEPAVVGSHTNRLAGAAIALAKLPDHKHAAEAKPIRCIRKGAAQAVAAFVTTNGGTVAKTLMDRVEEISRQGGTPLLVADGARALGVIQLKDIVKGGIKERFAQLRKMGVKTIMITGDNPLTAASIAAEAGVDDFIAQAKPEDKLARIRKEQEGGKLIAMIGDGTNDAPALAQADVGVAMNTGTQAAREAGNMVDLDSNPTKLIEVVEIGKQLLMTRGALTTFSIANDVSKYFAILPAMFGLLYAATAGGRGPLDKLNIMYLHSPQSAILSAVIFNALIIVALIPLALRGVKYRPLGAAVILRNNMLIYGVGGIIVPFIAIKLIDLLLVAIHLAP